ncbi:hypothetical protein BSPA111_03040 [Buttiauxella sp. A111]|nr:hypothetical protein BSPA111_03040 [Buttiauxella sp. A111]
MCFQFNCGLDSVIFCFYLINLHHDKYICVLRVSVGRDGSKSIVWEKGFVAWGCSSVDDESGILKKEALKAGK